MIALLLIISILLALLMVSGLHSFWLCAEVGRSGSGRPMLSLEASDRRPWEVRYACFTPVCYSFPLNTFGQIQLQTNGVQINLAINIT